MDITGINLPSPLAPHKTNFKMGRFYSSDSVGPKFNSLQVRVYTHNLWRGNGKFPRGRQVIFIGVIISLQVYFWIRTSAENILIYFARLLIFLPFFFFWLLILVERAPCRFGKMDDMSLCNDEVHGGTGGHKKKKGAFNSSLSQCGLKTVWFGNVLLSMKASFF